MVGYAMYMVRSLHQVPAQTTCRPFRTCTPGYIDRNDAAVVELHILSDRPQLIHILVIILRQNCTNSMDTQKIFHGKKSIQTVTHVYYFLTITEA